MNNKRTIIAVVVLLLILAVIFFLTSRDGEDGGDRSEAILSATAFNQTRNQNASDSAAYRGDVITYTLTVENPSDDVISGYVMEANISDLQELAVLTDAEGANYNPATGSLIWTPMDVPEKGSIQKKLSVRVKDELPAGSDLAMSLKFGNESTVAITTNEAPPAEAPSNGSTTNNPGTGGSTQGAQVTYNSPTTGPSEWLAVIMAFLSTLGLSVYRFKRKIA